MTEEEKIKLTNRIYPGIISCVNNRYKIIVGIFAYYAFVLNAESFLNVPVNHYVINWLVVFLFMLLTALNSFNYFCNEREQNKIEKLGGNWFTRNWIELFFLIIIVLFLIGSVFVVNSFPY